MCCRGRECGSNSQHLGNSRAHVSPADISSPWCLLPRCRGPLFRGILARRRLRGITVAALSLSDHRVSNQHLHRRHRRVGCRHCLVRRAMEVGSRDLGNYLHLRTDHGTRPRWIFETGSSRQQTRLARWTVGQVASVSGGGGPPETLSYDAAHHWTIANVSGGFPDTTFVDTLGRVTADVDPAGHRTKVFYEATFGNADSTVAADSQWTRAVMNAWGLDSIAQAEGQPRSLVLYDVLNRVTAAYDTVGGGPTTPRYDALYRTAVTDPKGQLYKQELNALGWPTRSYDALSPHWTRQFGKRR